jgi:cation transport regulator ChaC
MTTAAILAIIQLASALAPSAIELVNNLITAFDKSGMTDADIIKLLEDLKAELKPMELKA